MGSSKAGFFLNNINPSFSFPVSVPKTNLEFWIYLKYQVPSKLWNWNLHAIHRHQNLSGPRWSKDILQIFADVKNDENHLILKYEGIYYWIFWHHRTSTTTGMTKLSCPFTNFGRKFWPIYTATYFCMHRGRIRSPH